MLKIFQKNRNKSADGFVPESFEESTEYIANRYRGWYSVFNFNLSEIPDFTYLKTCLAADESLVLVFVDIGEKKGERLENDEIDRICDIIRFFYREGKNVILRVAYDHEGRAMEKEPPFFRQVLENIDDIGEILQKCEKEIFIFQGLLVGKWGEMHSSRYITTERLREMYEVLKKYRSEEYFFAVRRPKYWRNLNPGSVHAGENGCRLGLFDDGMFGSETDLGTYDTVSKNTAGWNGAWSRIEEAEFENELCRYVPNGGEALYGEEFRNNHGDDDVLRELEDRHITYLNSNHDPKMIEAWENSIYRGKDCWNGKSLYDYIGAHLGYRFFVSKVSFDLSGGGTLSVFIRNCGFAEIYKKTEICISYYDKNGQIHKLSVEYGLNGIEPGTEKAVSAVVKDACGDIMLKARTVCDGETVRFANEKALADGSLKVGRMCQ